MVALFKETIKVKHIPLTPVKSMSCMNLLLSSNIAFLHRGLYKSMRFQIVCDGKDVNFVVRKGRKRLRRIKHKI